MLPSWYSETRGIALVKEQSTVFAVVLNTFGQATSPGFGIQASGCITICGWVYYRRCHFFRRRSDGAGLSVDLCAAKSQAR